MSYKRMTVRIVRKLSLHLSEIAKSRGLSVNSLISEMMWNFVENWELNRKKHSEIGGKQEKSEN